MHHYYLIYLEEYARGALVEILAADRRHTEGLRKVEASFSSVLFSMVSPSRRRRRRRSRPPLRRFSSPFSWSLAPHFATSRKKVFLRFITPHLQKKRRDCARASLLRSSEKATHSTTVLRQLARCGTRSLGMVLVQIQQNVMLFLT